jgi:glycosyltransferase involved in cell wall biosynthesis
MSIMRNEISVVIPIYNSASYIESTLISVERSCYQYQYEVILVDDKSEDIGQVKKIIENYRYVLLVEKKEKTNAADSRNIGFKLAKYKKVFFLDSDDNFTEKYIDHRMELMESLDYGIYFGSYIQMVNNKKKITPRPAYSQGDIRDYIFECNGDFRTSTISVDKRFHKGTVFDPLMKKHQDWGFGIRCFDNNEKIFYDKSAHIIINEGRGDQMSATMNIDASKYFMQQYLKKGTHLRSFVEVHIIRAICNKDRSAIDFFFDVLERINIKDNNKSIKMTILRFGSKNKIIKITSLILINLRILKHFLK